MKTLLAGALLVGLQACAGLEDRVTVCTKVNCDVADADEATGNSELVLRCTGEGDTISKVFNAQYGVFPLGTGFCPFPNDEFFQGDPDFEPVTTCAADADDVAAFILEQCKDKNECVLNMSASGLTVPGCVGQQRQIAAHVLCDEGVDVFQVAISLVIALIGLGMGATVDISMLKIIVRDRKRALFIGAFCQFAFMPLIVLAFTEGLNIRVPLAIGLYLVGTSPGGSTSNLFTYFAKGNVALSITMSAFSTFAAFGLMPLMLLLYIGVVLDAGDTISVDYLSIFTTLLLVVIPASIGVYIRNYQEKYAKKVEIVGSTLGVIFVAAALIIGVQDNRALLDPTAYPNVFITSVFLQQLGCLIGYICATVAKLPHPDRRAICLEVGVQNTVLAISVAALSFPIDTNGCSRKEVLIGPLLCTFWYLINSIWITGFLRYLSRYDDPEEDEEIYKENQIIHERGMDL